jgi:hypothetical protein
MNKLDIAEYKNKTDWYFESEYSTIPLYEILANYAENVYDGVDSIIEEAHAKGLHFTDTARMLRDFLGEM